MDHPRVHLHRAEQCLLKTSGFRQQDRCFARWGFEPKHVVDGFLSTTRSPEHPVPSTGSSTGITSTPASQAGQPLLFGKRSAFPDFIYCFV